MKLILTYLGMDSWDRPVYKDQDGNLWKDVDPREGRKPDLCTVDGNRFDGEPSTNLSYFSDRLIRKPEIEFIPERITWRQSIA